MIYYLSNITHFNLILTFLDFEKFRNKKIDFILLKSYKSQKVKINQELLKFLKLNFSI